MHERLQEGLLRRLHEAAEEQRQLRVAHLACTHAERVRRLPACRRQDSASRQITGSRRNQLDPISDQCGTSHSLCAWRHACSKVDTIEQPTANHVVAQRTTPAHC